MNSPRSGPWTERARFGLALALIGACFLWGGGSRLDIPGLIFLQPLTILIGAALLLIPGERRWAAVRVPLLLLAALAVVMMAQLVPLPPALWQALPGHGQFAPFIEAAGAGDYWRPLSLTPDLTLASLVGLGVPATGLIAFASVSEERSHQLLPYLLIAAGLSAVVGLGQLVGGPNSAFYRYAVTNEGSAVGLFSNRNHQALFIAMVWPMLALWVTARGLEPARKRLRRWIGGAAAIGLVPMILVTGSRAGLLLALVALAFAGWFLRANARASHELSTLPPWVRRAAPALILLAIVAVGLLAAWFSRDEAFQRLYATNLADERRFAQLPILLRIAGDFLPFGSGFGGFDPVYRYYEPDALLAPTYLNHAHNDVLELIITGGAPAAAIALAFLLWITRRFLALRGWLPRNTRDRFAYLAAALIVLALLASVADYPLRTPIHALLFAFACGWLAAAQPAGRSRSAG